MKQPTPAERDAIYRSDFLAFAQAAFFELEPDNTFEPSWHHEAIAQLLVESKGKKTRKYINAPPRSLKSFNCSRYDGGAEAFDKVWNGGLKEWVEKEGSKYADFRLFNVEATEMK
jgi:hypothetical protein